MITFQVSDLFEFTTPNAPRNYKLYMVYDRDVCFYVGKSQRGVINRLYEHLGANWADWGPWPRPSMLGSTIYLNRPLSDMWRVAMLTPGHLGEKGGVIKGISREEWESQWWHKLPYTDECAKDKTFFSEMATDFGEKELIKLQCPCLNFVHNYTPSEFPHEKYHHLFFVAYSKKRDYDTGFWTFTIENMAKKAPKGNIYDVERLLAQLADN